MKIDFVSDVACPWCAVGLNSLEIAIQRLGTEVAVQLHFQPFELNPALPAEGENAAEHLKRKYSLDDAALARNRSVLHERGAAVGFHFGDRPWVWNTHAAHRLLHWAGLPEQQARQPRGQQRLKHALLQAYHGAALNPGSPEVLLDAAATAGLDAAAAAAVVDSQRYSTEVQRAELHWQRAGIRSVPAVVVDDRHLISGGQPPEVFERALREIAAGQAQV